MYSSLHNHSMYSLLDGYATPKEYMERAKEIGLKAFAISEHGSEYSWCYFDKIKKDYPDIKMIYGVEFYECFNTEIKDKESKYFLLVVLAKNEEGRKAINKFKEHKELVRDKIIDFGPIYGYIVQAYAYKQDWNNMRKYAFEIIDNKNRA